jgi:hypothetical protein
MCSELLLSRFAIFVLMKRGLQFGSRRLLASASKWRLNRGEFRMNLAPPQAFFLSVAAFYFKSQVAYVHSVLVEAEVPWPINFPRLLLHTLFYYRQMLLEPIDSHGISHRHFSNR